MWATTSRLAAVCGTMLIGMFLQAALGQDAAVSTPGATPEPATQPVSAMNAEANMPPYIATYYVQPKVPVSEKAVINYYLTDAEHKEYMRDDRSETFTVDYWVNGKKETVSNVAAGDNAVSFGPLPKGKVLFALQATDRLGRKSHRLFQEFLVVDPADEAIPAEKVLQNPDLAKFGIHNDDTHPAETTQGLTNLFKWASEQGYRKLVLPAGRYRIDETKTVQMATKLTVDMNGSTFKLNPNALAKALMVEFVDCYDAHLINGTLEGDLKEHDFKNAPNNSEWVSAISISQGSEYCSVRDLTIVDITGYGSNTNHRHSYDFPKHIKKFELGDIDAKGNAIPSDQRATSVEPVDIEKFIKSHGFIQLGVYLGYQGNPARNWVYKAHFYDADKKYLESIEGYMYRRMYPPKDAKFARFTLFNNVTPENLNVYNFRAPYNCAYVNVKHKNIRCVGMALAGFNNLLVEGCTFENCGSSSARCAFDAEDGWDLMQDLTFRNNVFGENPNNEFLTCGGHNFVMENNTMKVHTWDRTNGFVLRNNTVESGSFYFGQRVRTGYPRIQGNTFQKGVTVKTMTETPDREFAVRDSICENGVGGEGNKTGQLNGIFFKCTISGNVNGKVVGSTIKNMKNAGGRFEIYDSQVSDSAMKSTGAGVQSKIVGSTVRNSEIIAQGVSIVLEKNTLHGSVCNTSSGWSDAEEFVLTNNTVHTSKEHLVFVNNSYKQIVLDGNTIHATDPKFSAVVLNNPTNKNLVNQKVTIHNNTFDATAGHALNVPRLPHADCTLTVDLSGNKYGKLTPFSANLAKVPNVKISGK